MDDQLTKHLHRVHFECKCGCGFDDVDPMLYTGVEEFIRLLEAETGREMTVGYLGGPAPNDHRKGRHLIKCNADIEITGPLRCPEHDLAVTKKEKTGQHVGKAVDIQVPGFTGEELAAIAMEIPAFKMGGIGTYHNRVHVDVRGHRARWTG